MGLVKLSKNNKTNICNSVHKIYFCVPFLKRGLKNNQNQWVTKQVQYLIASV